MKRLCLIVLAALILIFHQQIFQWCFVAYNRLTEKPAPPPPPKAQKFTVAASFPAAASFARTIGGAHIDVVSPLPRLADPVTWVPVPADVESFFSADLIVLGGAGLERWANLYRPPAERTLRLAEAVRTQWIGAPEGSDPHLFLAPDLAVSEVESLRDELARRDAPHGADYAKNAGLLRQELENLGTRFKALPIHAVFSSNGRHAYLARFCGWQVASFDLNPALAPSPAQLERLAAEVKAHPEAKVMLWDEKPSPEIERHMTRLGLVGVVFDPMLREIDPANPKDFVAVMRGNLERLRDTGK